MTKSPQTADPPLGMGLTSVILGAVGVLLFFLPILSIPLGGVGLVFGLSSLVLALVGGWTSLRWSIAGVVTSGLALAVGIAIAQAPAGYLPTGTVPLNTQPVPERPYVPPPARPGNVTDSPAGAALLSPPRASRLRSMAPSHSLTAPCSPANSSLSPLSCRTERRAARNAERG